MSADACCRRLFMVKWLRRAEGVCVEAVNRRPRRLCGMSSRFGDLRGAGRRVEPVFLAVVVYFDAEDYGGADEGDRVGEGERPYLLDYSLDDEEERTEAHHQEGGQGDSVGVARADG